MILESNGDFYVQFASVSGLHQYKVCLIFIIAYLDEFKPSFTIISGGGHMEVFPKIQIASHTRSRIMSNNKDN